MISIRRWLYMIYILLNNIKFTYVLSLSTYPRIYLIYSYMDRYPSTSGTSVVGLVYDGGVMVAADTLGSYGSLARFRNVERTFKVTDKAVLTCSGDIADYQFIREVIEQKV